MSSLVRSEETKETDANGDEVILDSEMDESEVKEKTLDEIIDQYQN